MRSARWILVGTTLLSLLTPRAQAHIATDVSARMTGDGSVRLTNEGRSSTFVIEVVWNDHECFGRSGCSGATSGVLEKRVTLTRGESRLVHFPYPDRADQVAVKHVHRT